LRFQYYEIIPELKNDLIKKTISSLIELWRGRRDLRSSACGERLIKPRQRIG
jgi:hypothetical protein